MILNLVSIYVPVNADERRTFLKQQMYNHRKIPPGSIIGGDFNCVENPIFDVMKENGGTHQNKHAGLLKTVMSVAYQTIDSLDPSPNVTCLN